MKLFPALIGLFFMVAAGSAACGGNLSLPGGSHQGGPSGESVMDYTRLIARLRAAGVSALPAGEAEQSFISVQGRMIKIGGEDVQVFQYAHAAAAAEQAALVSPDGSAVGTSMIHWIDSPHFFRKDLLLVLYVGDDEKIIKALEAVLGRQFAGK